MSKKAKTEPSAFFLSFVGEYVQVISSFQMAHPEEMEGAGLPLMIEGFVLDADDDYIYLGPDPEEGIKQAIKKDFVVFVQALEQGSDIEDAFSGLTSGTKKRDMN